VVGQSEEEKGKVENEVQEAMRAFDASVKRSREGGREEEEALKAEGPSLPARLDTATHTASLRTSFLRPSLHPSLDLFFSGGLGGGP